MDDSLPGVARLRELGLASPQAAQRALHFPESAARRLSIEAILRGHHGCVNRLNWNESGSLLASGSDDRKVMLWSYPDTQRQPIALETEHQANIFGVRFLPQTSDARLVTGAMDYTVQLHQLDTPPASMKPPVRTDNGGGGSRRNPNVSATPASARTVVYTCHRSRVKDVAVEALNPHLFWSAAEDGAVRQFDTRVPTSQQRDYESPNMLLAVKHKGRSAELKSLNLNPAKPHQLVVGASDPYVRVFDRRKLSTGSPERGHPPAAPVLSLAPPHLALCAAGGGGGRHSRMHATYVAFGNRGDKVIATYHGDHAYSFDTTGAAAPAAAPAGTTAAAQQRAGGSAPLPVNLFEHPTAMAALVARNRGGAGGSGGGSGTSSGFTSSGSGGMGDLPGMLPAAAERAKADGNLHLFSKKFYEAERRYSEAIRLAPWAPVLYTNRALALLQRGWEGDALCALRDAETAVCLEPGGMKAHYRRAQALRAAGMLQSAAAAVRLFKQQFPDKAGDVEALEEQIAADTARQAQQAELRRQQAEQRRQQRRRRGLQFDRARRDRRQRAAAAGHQEGRAVEATEGGTAAAPTVSQRGHEAGQPAAEPAGASSLQADAQPASGAAAAAHGEAGGARGAAASLPPVAGAAPAGGDTWDDLYASASSEDEDEEDAAAAATAAAASSGIDAAYAAALEAAAAAGGTPEGAAAAAEAPSIDGLLEAAGQQQGRADGMQAWRRQPSLWHSFEGGRRLLQRFVGQCNLQTDIKEACFLGADDALVAAGSDDGRVFIFNAATGECIRVFMADEDVANAVQPHPHLPVLATSGIESTIKVWSPEGEPTTGGDVAEIIRRNQGRLKEGPTVLRGVDPRIIAALTDNPELLRALVQRATRQQGSGSSEGGGEEEEDESEEDVREVSCRVA
ncbi:hypothetical protein ABPG77_006035 [Micractinium sp. CCAP 211/92]